jgi:NSS family neurotransmitter:Na+ symporter
MPGGGVSGAVFFIMVTIAALTSNIALAEALVAMLADKFRIKRKTALALSLLVYISLGIPSALGYGALGGIKLFGLGILELFDFVASNLLMPIIALITVLFIGYVIKPKELIAEVEESGSFKHKRLFSVVIRYVAPPTIAVILLTSFLELFGVIKI